MNDDTIILPASPANDNARALALVAPGIVGGIKSLLCDDCGAREAAHEGRCGECLSDGAAHVDGRRGGDEWL